MSCSSFSLRQALLLGLKGGIFFFIIFPLFSAAAKPALSLYLVLSEIPLLLPQWQQTSAFYWYKAVSYLSQMASRPPWEYRGCASPFTEAALCLCLSWGWKVSYPPQGQREFATTPPLEKGFCLRSEGERVCFGFTQGKGLGPRPNPTATGTTCSPVLPMGVLWPPGLPHYFSGAPGGGLGLQTHSSHTGLRESVTTSLVW